MRTIDFVRIAEILRSYAGTSSVAAKLIETVDEFGMNMICADELSSTEFREFFELMRKVAFSLGNEENGLGGFIRALLSSMQADERLSD